MNFVCQWIYLSLRRIQIPVVVLVAVALRIFQYIYTRLHTSVTLYVA